MKGRISWWGLGGFACAGPSRALAQKRNPNVVSELYDRASDLADRILRERALALSHTSSPPAFIS